MKAYNEDGTWSYVQPEPLYIDPRPKWKRLIELPFRMLGIIRYSPLKSTRERDEDLPN